MKHALHNMSASGFWLNCDLWVHYKIEDIEAGVKEETSAAAARGHKLHAYAEYAMHAILFDDFDLTNAINYAETEYKRKNKRAKKLSEDDRQQLRIALQAGLELIPDDMSIDLELEVPLSHEPQSVGYVDIAGYNEDFILCADYKFGEMAVSPNASQLKGYSANMLALYKEQGIRITEDTKVKLAIIQPRLHREAAVRAYRAYDLIKFQIVTEATVLHQLTSSDRRGAGSLASCNYCPFETRCAHNTRLRAAMFDHLASEDELPTEVIEDIVRSRTKLKAVIDEYASRIASDPVTYPNWRRYDVRNKRHWDPLVEADEIADQLIAGGLEDPYLLISPAAAKKGAKGINTLVDSLSTDEGHHVRVAWVDPTELPEDAVEPERVPQTERRVSKKAKPKKAAPKKRAKAKKATPKKRATPKKKAKPNIKKKAATGKAKRKRT